ncbi:hypothetical protein F5H01DRAFT_35367 [Linnemannia elongata]|nr:hypothetical protein F5H01DRAFT_35367 [Linnemannia elongata]
MSLSIEADIKKREKKNGFCASKRRTQKPMVGLAVHLMLVRVLAKQPTAHIRHCCFALFSSLFCYYPPFASFLVFLRFLLFHSSLPFLFSFLLRLPKYTPPPFRHFTSRPPSRHYSICLYSFLKRLLFYSISPLLSDFPFLLFRSRVSYLSFISKPLSNNNNNLPIPLFPN